MKNAIRILVLIILTASMTSCDWIKGLTDVEIDTTIEGTLNILTDEAELKSTDAYRLDASTTITVLNSDLEDYAELIEDYETQNITIEVLYVDTEGVMILAGSEFSIYSQKNPGYTWPVPTDWPIEVGFTATLEADSYSVIDELLDAGDPITFSAFGTCNKGDVTIGLNYGIKVLVTSNPL